MTQKALIVKESALKSDSDHEVIDYRTLKEWCKSGKIFCKFRYYNEVTFNLDCSPKYRRAVLLGSLAYFLKKRTSTIKYANQKEVNVSFLFLFKRFFILVRDLLRRPLFLTSLKRKIAMLLQCIPSSVSLSLVGTPYYFRTDFHFNLITGGSVGHIAGVLNNLEKHIGTAPIFLTSTTIPTVKKEIESHIVIPKDQFLDYNNLPNFAFSKTISATWTWRSDGSSKVELITSPLTERSISEEIKAFCKENMAGYKRPRLIEFRQELPVSAVGKILRRVLRDEELKK